jgi:hypothetical protein
MFTYLDRGCISFRGRGSSRPVASDRASGISIEACLFRLFDDLQPCPEACLCVPDATKSSNQEERRGRMMRTLGFEATRGTRLERDIVPPTALLSMPSLFAFLLRGSRRPEADDRGGKGGPLGKNLLWVNTVVRHRGPYIGGSLGRY